MNPDLLISLVGEQPTPIFLVHKALDPVQHLLVATSKDAVKRAANNIASTLNLPKSAILPDVDSYDIKAAAEKIENTVEDFLPNGVHIALNLTGGTKTMALAGYELARKHKWRIYYLETRRNDEVLHRYDFTNAAEPPTGPHQEILPEILNISDYISIHGFDPSGRGSTNDPFEREIGHILSGLPYEALHSFKTGQIEIDFIVRKGNRIAFIEAKSGNQARKKSGIDQLHTAASPQHFGTYVNKMLIGDELLPENNTILANSRDIRTLATPSFRSSNHISEEDAQNLKTELERLFA
ncbi:MAG TPA: DUF1887 family CARF protein [Chthoniobacterales bacterium]